MKKILVILLLSTWLSACHDSHTSAVITSANPTAVAIPALHLRGQWYRFGPQMDTSECKALAPCDCCVTDIVFVDERRFVAIFLCLQDDTYAHGSYRIDGDRVYLSYEGKKVDVLSDFVMPTDTLDHSHYRIHTVIRYKVDTMPHSIDTLSAFMCRSVIGFKSRTIDYGTPEGSAASSLEYLRRDSILQRMEFE